MTGTMDVSHASGTTASRGGGPRREAAVSAEVRAERAARARVVATDLAARGVAGVAVDWVDNAGVCRVKTFPIRRLEHVAAWGVGASPVFDVFLADDSITETSWSGGPVGDLRLVPDLDRVVVSAAQPGWAWAPGDRLAQDGTAHPLCTRGFARRMQAEAARRGLALRAGFEVEWVVARAGSADEPPVVAAEGPAYGMQRVVECADYLRDLLAAFAAQDMAVLQLHPEYTAGQFEVSLAPEDGVGAADTAMAVRHTVRAVSARHGLRASFAPVVLPGSVGNGGHLHVSLWRDVVNMMQGGDRVHGLTGEAEGFVAGIVDALPGLTAVGAPSAASFLRLVPSRWAGAYRCWGWENREAAVRLITGSVGERATSANVEVKSFDGAANPYAAMGAVIAAGLDGIDRGLSLPPETHGNPEGTGAERLPASLEDAADAFERCGVLAAAMGPELHGAITAVRRAEGARFPGATAEEIVAATRWRF
ncbi:glutamine synthetase family protein [Yinghuangia sp. ASG 101]|uniref:glutamine synthetase family protein n=1 Tax=Yinghuangia sp. ASG 101 TaxID=2896848 RepID=UPI001E3FC32A|nr:glutamine synthetase family protein [Yinghuangia sp. ASG 101]UGQ11894.1 glutamine synthetase family protein [Yinghuangia sp. ASG 101]